MQDNTINIFNSPTNYYDEIITHIFSYLDPVDLLKIKQVSIKFQHLCPPIIVFKDRVMIQISELEKEKLKNCSETIKRIWNSHYPYNSSNTFKENSSNTLKLPEFSNEEFFQVMKCLENKELINEENVLELATIADQLEMPELLNDYDQFLATQLSNLELNDNNLDSVIYLISNTRINSLKISKKILVSYLESYLEYVAKKMTKIKLKKFKKT